MTPTIQLLGKYFEVIDLILLNKNIKKIHKENKKKIIFTVGNTRKINNNKSYFTPIRNFRSYIVWGVNVYSEKEAIDCVKVVDKYSDYIFVDCEKKISKADSLFGYQANLERRIKEKIKNAKVFLYKGNDITVDAADNFLSNYFKNDLRGVGGKIISILGAGNIGSKLALKLVERGAKVIITRKNNYKLKIITRALNFIKPQFTQERINGLLNNYKATKYSDVIFGCSNSKTPIITKSLVKNCKKLKIIIDIGKGSISEEAIHYIEKKSIKVYRLDVTSTLLTMIDSQINYHKFFSKKTGRKKIDGHICVSGGELGKKGDLVVNDIYKPKNVYGVANGKGDFSKRFYNLSFDDFKKKFNLQNIK